MKTLAEWRPDNTFCIHLARSVDRMPRFDQEIARIGCGYTLWPATDGITLPDHPYLTRGQLGCFLSHRAVWRQALRMGLEEIVVLEDDVVFSDDFPAEFDAFMAEDHPGRKITRLHYSGVGCPTWQGREFDGTDGNGLILGSPLFGAVAYILKLGAILSLAAVETPMEVDYLLFGSLPPNESSQRHQWAGVHHIPNYVPMDNLCWNDGGLSEITGDTVEQPRNQRLRRIQEIG